MSPLVSRILVGAALLPVVLGVAWLGGWWLTALAAVAAVLALHEFYSMTRSLRPLVLAGYVAALLVLAATETGGLEWMLGAFLSVLPVAFLLQGLAGARQSTTVAVGATALGVAWIALGLAHLLLLRGIDGDGRLAIFTVLLAVFAADTAAYFAGRLVGRHKLAPTVSPGKTWEGFIAGTAAALAVTFFALYEEDFMPGWRSLVLGGSIAIAALLGDLFESAVKRDMQVKDSGRMLAGHGGVLDRLDAPLFAGVVAFYVVLAFGYA